eukprot:evm.model.scf_3337.1 EVM.evm.TU.scf_3337.1   scf_3337:10233-11780(+)
MAFHRWDHLPVDCLDSLKDVLEAGQPQSTSVLKGVHPVNRHWHEWATRATTVLRPCVPRVHDDPNLVSDMLEASASAFPNVEELILRKHLHVQDSHLTLLESFPKLVSLKLSGYEWFSEDGVAVLGRLSNLTKLNLDRTMFGCPKLASARWLENLTGLTDLTLHGRSPGDGSFEHLAALTLLVSLDMWGSNHLCMTDDDAELLTTLSSLTCLKTSSYITDMGLRHLARLTLLRWLALKATNDVTDVGLCHVATLPLLTHLHVGGCPNVTDVGIGILADELPSLTVLELPYSCAAGASVQNLLSFTALTSLDVSNSALSSAGVHSLGKLRSLSTLRLSSVTDATMRSLAVFPSLTDLVLTSMPGVSDEGLRTMSLLSALRSLECDLYATQQVSEVGLVSLGALLALTNLKLGFGLDNGIGDAGVRSIAMLTSLEVLSLRGSQITDDGLRSVAMLTSLTYLDLCLCSRITDSGVGCLASLVSLTYLDFFLSQVTDAAAASFSTLSSLTTLRITGLTS